MRAEVQRLTLAEGQEALAQADRIARFGRRALPSIEAALHTAEEPGRKNLVVAIRRIGDAEAIPLLVHLAVYDGAEDVRREADWTLRSWAQAQDKDARAEKARAAVRRIDELKGRQESG